MRRNLEPDGRDGRGRILFLAIFDFYGALSDLFLGREFIGSEF